MVRFIREGHEDYFGGFLTFVPFDDFLTETSVESRIYGTYTCWLTCHLTFTLKIKNKFFFSSFDEAEKQIKKSFEGRQDNI